MEGRAPSPHGAREEGGRSIHFFIGLSFIAVCCRLFFFMSMGMFVGFFMFGLVGRPSFLQ